MILKISVNFYNLWLYAFIETQSKVETLYGVTFVQSELIIYNSQFIIKP